MQPLLRLMTEFNDFFFQASRNVLRKWQILPVFNDSVVFCNPDRAFLALFYRIQRFWGFVLGMSEGMQTPDLGI